MAVTDCYLGLVWGPTGTTSIVRSQAVKRRILQELGTAIAARGWNTLITGVGVSCLNGRVRSGSRIPLTYGFYSGDIRLPTFQHTCDQS